MDINNHISGAAKACAFRWHEYARPGEYVVNVIAPPGEEGYCYWHDVPGNSHSYSFDFSANFRAVVDDFGRLVRVQ